jgi:hypothetical protein
MVSNLKRELDVIGTGNSDYADVEKIDGKRMKCSGPGVQILCARCATFDFDELLSPFFPANSYDQSATQTWTRTWEPIHDLGSPSDAPRASGCSFCKLLAAILPGNSSEAFTLCRFGN